MGSDPADQSPSDLEEGEFVAAGSDDDSRYALQHHHGGSGGDDARPEIKRRRLEFQGVVADGGALPSPTPSRECDSDGTVSDIDADDGAASLAQELLFPCPVCGREFASKKAACGHMRAHVPQGRQQGNKERPAVVAPAISGGWAVTGKRGSVGGRSVSPESQGVVDSMAVVVSEPVIDPMTVAFASRSSSAEPNPPNDDSMALVVASSDSPTSQIIVHPPCSPQFRQGHQPAVPQVVVAQAQPTVAQGPQLAEAAAPQFVVHQPAAPQVVQRTSPPPPARDEQGWWLCKEKGCDHRRFATHQGLGGHMAGHKNRENNEAAAAALHLGVGAAACAKPAKLHPCKHCPRVFTSGVELGGHMRKHYEGKVTPKRHGASPKVSAPELASALALSRRMPPAAMEVAPAQPPVAPASPVVPGVVRIFGVDIVATPPAAAAKETSSAVTETDQSSAASTNTEQ